VQPRDHLRWAGQSFCNCPSVSYKDHQQKKILTSSLCLPIWAFLSGGPGKREAYLISLVLWTIIQISLTFTPGSQRVVLYVQSAFASGSFVIPWSMLPDTIDLDELNTNKTREGAFYGFFVFFQNFGIAGGLALSNLFLDTQG
jgi:GPH family glycoside/pentoside/hexuronide:cation symporter